jgi:hypothetical protein
VAVDRDAVVLRQLDARGFECVADRLDLDVDREYLAVSLHDDGRRRGGMALFAAKIDGRVEREQGANSDHGHAGEVESRAS